MLNIETNTPASPFALFNLGFRPFFLSAAGFAVVAMAIWMGMLVFGWTIQPFGSVRIWHAHEMIFGYSLAVIAGFLLTAIKNWTNTQTLHGLPLSLLLLLWLAGRVLPFFSQAPNVDLLAVVDNLFILVLFLALAYPIIRARQWQHGMILAILLLLLASNTYFYYGLLHMSNNVITISLYSGLYLVMGLIFLMGRRVIPFFIEKGVDEEVKLKNFKWLDILSPIVFLVFWYADLFSNTPDLISALALSLFFLHTIRLVGWHSRGLWQRPLLWSIYLAYASLTFGFALKAAASQFLIPPVYALHAFAVGGIAMMTLGMMARVALGHTGRNVFTPPPILGTLFILLFFAAIVRVLLPMFIPGQYLLWIGFSQVLWIMAFTMFFVLFFPILCRPRIDGRSG